MISDRRLTILAIVGTLLLGTLACKTALFSGRPGEECDIEESCRRGVHCCYDAICHECCEDEDCGPRGKCDEFECVRCDTDHDCLEGLHCCDDANCEECCYDMHCDQGENCEDYKCVPVEEPSELEPECTVDGDCEDVEHCGAAGCACADGICVEAEPECSEDQDCVALHEEGWECTGGQCTEAEPECTEGADCDYGYCCDGTCGECCDDGDCDKDEFCSGNLECTSFAETGIPCADDEDCDEEFECENGICVCGEDCTEPSPDAELVLPFILREFEEKYNDCFDSGDPVALGKLFHDAVNDLYGPDQCPAYTESVIGTHINIKITGWTGPGPFSWMIDGRSILIDDAYTVQVDFTRDTTITSQLEFHPAVRADGSLGLLTDCGDPLPLPVKPECTANQDCEGGECIDGHCVEHVATTVNGSLPPPRPYEGDVLFDYIYVVPGTLFDLQPWYKQDLSALQQTLDQSVASGKLQEDGTFSVSVPPGPHIFLAGWHGPPGGPPYQILVVEFDAKDGGPVQLGWVDGSS